MKDIYRILRRPIVTEMGTELKRSHNKVIFVVDSSSNKSDIKMAVECLFKVKVTKVNTANQIGKVRRFGKRRQQGRLADWKKAIVTLKKGDKIELLEGM